MKFITLSLPCLLFALLSACGGGGGGGSSTPAAAAPKVTLNASQAMVSSNTPLTLSWTSSDANACAASGAWSGALASAGQLKLTPMASGTQTFSLTCTGAGGSTATSASVSVGGPKPFAINSISFALAGSNYLDEAPDMTPIPDLIAEFLRLGANDVKVVVSAGYYEKPTSNLPSQTLSFQPSDAKLTQFLAQLKTAGLQVTLSPFVTIAFDPNGNLLDTVHPQPTDFKAWMVAHTKEMVRYAKIAQQTGVDRIAVLDDAVQPLTFDLATTPDWLDMMAQIRAVYTGHLTSILYSDGSLFSGRNHIDLTGKPVIDALDSIGVGWFPQPLTNTKSPSYAQLAAAWRKTVKGVDTVAFFQDLHQRYNKPVWMADIAFHSFSGDNVSSGSIYDVGIPLTVDELEQANQYESLFSVLRQDLNQPWFLGVSADSWNRFNTFNNGLPRYLNSALGENIKGKQAEGVLTRWFNGHGTPRLQ